MGNSRAFRRQLQQRFGKRDLTWEFAIKKLTKQMHDKETNDRKNRKPKAAEVAQSVSEGLDLGSRLRDAPIANSPTGHG